MTSAHPSFDNRPPVLLVDIGPEEKKRPIVVSMMDAPYDLSLLTNNAIGNEVHTWRSRYIPNDRTLSASYRKIDEVTRVITDRFGDSLQGVTTYQEVAVPTANRIAEIFNLPPITHGNVEALRDKALMRQFFKEAGIPQPEFRRVSTFEEAKAALKELGAPCIVKPIAMGASLAVKKIPFSPDLEEGYDEVELYRAFNNAQTIDSPAELYRYQYELTSDVIIEKYIPAIQEISVEAFAHHGEVIIASVTDKLTGKEPYFDEWGHTTNITLATPELAAKVNSDLQAAVRSLGLNNCILHGEFRITPEGIPFLVELAGRMGGDLIPILVKHAVGIDLPKVSLDLAVDKPNLSVEKTKDQGAAVLFIDDEKKASILDWHRNRIPHEVTEAFPGTQFAEIKIYSPENVDLGRYGHVILTGPNAAELIESRKYLQDRIAKWNPKDI